MENKQGKPDTDNIDGFIPKQEFDRMTEIEHQRQKEDKEIRDIKFQIDLAQSNLKKCREILWNKFHIRY